MAKSGVAEYHQTACDIRPPLKGPSMIFGMTTATYTLIHVIISLIGIGSGLVVMYGMLTGKKLDGWTALFLTTTVLTSVTGFGFPFKGATPAINLGVISLVVLAVAVGCALRSASRRSLAQDLRYIRGLGPLFQRLRSGRAVL
jgi:hypothetical protein